LAIVGREGQAVLEQAPVEVHRPFVQVADKVPVKPVLQTGVHVVPVGELETQFPIPALVITGSDGQLVVEHVPEVVHNPELQVAERVPEKPELKTGVHVVPVTEFATQSPGLAFATLGKVAHEVLVQVPLVTQDPPLQVAERVPENPELQTGVHVVPEVAFVVQSPVPASPIVNKVAQGEPPEATQTPVVDQTPRSGKCSGKSGVTNSRTRGARGRVRGTIASSTVSDRK
jgi:hypothetical protein